MRRSGSNIPSGGESHPVARRFGWLVTIVVLGLMAYFLTACAAAEPKPYTIAGAWSGSTAAGFLAVTLTQNGQAVSGSGRFRPTGGAEQSITLPNGQLNADSTLFVTATTVPDGVNAQCSGQLQGTYRMAEHNANRFVAQFTCGTWSFQAQVSRE